MNQFAEADEKKDTVKTLFAKIEERWYAIPAHMAGAFRTSGAQVARASEIPIDLIALEADPFNVSKAK
jgi:hypothetical protein